jgi:hypothetical protein
MNKRKTATFILFLFLTITTGCGQQQPAKALSPSDAHQTLVRLLKEENNLKVVTKEFEHTLWVYLPSEENFFQMKAKSGRPQGPSGPTVLPAIYFLDGKFEDENFEISYDIGPSKNYAKDPGYTSQVSEAYQIKQQNILAAIYRAYAGSGDKAPDFFVIVMADVVNGLEYRILFYLKDLIRFSTDQTFLDEYQKRFVSKQPFGDTAIIGDKKGNHIDFKDISWPEFLTKQILYRVQYRYQPATLPPSDNPEEEILRAAAQTVDAYGFTDFSSVQLHDLSDDSTDAVTREDLSAYNSEPSRGRLIHIQFQ